MLPILLKLFLEFGRTKPGTTVVVSLTNFLRILIQFWRFRATRPSRGRWSGILKALDFQAMITRGAVAGIALHRMYQIT